MTAIQLIGDEGLFLTEVVEGSLPLAFQKSSKASGMSSASRTRGRWRIDEFLDELLLAAQLGFAAQHGDDFAPPPVPVLSSFGFQ
jgi:hypothetical protein